MRNILCSLVLALAIAAPVRGDEASVRAVISSQIEAFRRGDVAGAFGYASPSVQGIFQSPERFGVMVQNGYPMVWRPAEVRFLGVESIDGLLWQTVMIKDQAGQLHLLEYQMIPGEGGWKINAVRFKQMPDGVV